MARTNTKQSVSRRSFWEEFNREAVQTLLDGNAAPSLAERLGLLEQNVLDRRKRETLQCCPSTRPRPRSPPDRDPDHVPQQMSEEKRSRVLCLVDDHRLTAARPTRSARNAFRSTSQHTVAKMFIGFEGMDLNRL